MVKRWFVRQALVASFYNWLARVIHYRWYQPTGDFAACVWCPFHAVCYDGADWIGEEWEQ